MQCPYCAEDIKDGATACRYCDRDLSFYAPIGAAKRKTVELENKVQNITERLDEFRPINQDVVLKRISNVESQVQTIVAFLLRLDAPRSTERGGISPHNEVSGYEETNQKNCLVPAHEANLRIDKREEQKRDQQGAKGRRQGSKQEGTNEDQSSAKASSLIKVAARDVIDNLTTANPEWRLIWFSVLFASVFAILGFQLGNLLTAWLDTLHPLNDYAKGLLWWGHRLVDFFQSFVFIFPFIFGFRASLAWPEARNLKRLMTYLLLGLLIGLMTFSGNVLLNLLGGALDLPANTFKTDDYFSGWQDATSELQVYLAIWFTSAGALFILGAVLADSVKAKKKASKPAP